MSSELGLDEYYGNLVEQIEVDNPDDPILGKL